MSRPEKAYIPIIKAIKLLVEEYLYLHAFSTWEVCNITGYHRNRVTKILEQLKTMGYLIKTKKGFAHRVWVIKKSKWPTTNVVDTIVEDYELFRLVNMGNPDCT